MNTGIRLSKAPGRAPGLKPMPRPGEIPGQALIRVATVGLCRTDLLVADGSIETGFEVTLGHEFSGYLERAAGDLPAGELVAVDPTFALDSGRDGYMGVDDQGCIATWAAVPESKILAAGALTPRQAAYLEPVACALGGLRAAAQAGGTGLIVGSNRIADLTAHCFSTGLHWPDWGPARFERMDHGAFSEAVEGGLRNAYDWILETRLSDGLLRDAAAALRPNGTLIAKSRHLDAVRIPIRDYVLKGLTIAGRTRTAFPPALGWLHRNADFVSTLLGEEFAIAEWQRAFAAANSGEGLKTFVTPLGG